MESWKALQSVDAIDVSKDKQGIAPSPAPLFPEERSFPLTW